MWLKMESSGNSIVFNLEFILQHMQYFCYFVNAVNRIGDHNLLPHQSNCLRASG